MGKSIDNVVITKKYDRRIKVTPEIEADVKGLYNEGNGMGIRAIAREYDGKISRRTIQFILFPERRERVAEQFKERRKDGRYYYKDEWRKTMREHRAYKRKLMEEGLI